MKQTPVTEGGMLDPAVERAQFIVDNAHIPTKEIENDIRDTSFEIVQMSTEAKWLEEAPRTYPEARMCWMKAQAKWREIKERQEFVKALQALLDARSTANATRPDTNTGD